MGDRLVDCAIDHFDPSADFVAGTGTGSSSKAVAVADDTCLAAGGTFEVASLQASSVEVGTLQASSMVPAFLRETSVDEALLQASLALL